MNNNLLPFGAVSFDQAGAAAATGLSERTIRDAIRNGDLIAHYLGKKPVILRDDLAEWISSLPTERRTDAA